MKTINETARTALSKFGAFSGRSESAKVGMKQQANKFLAQGYLSTDIAPIEVDDSINTSSPEFLRQVKRGLAEGCLTAFQLQLYTEQEDSGIHGKGTRYYKEAREASAKAERARVRLYKHAVQLELKEAPQEVQDQHAEVSQLTKSKAELISSTRRCEQYMTTEEKTAFMKGQVLCLQAIIKAERRIAND